MTWPSTGPVAKQAAWSCSTFKDEPGELVPGGCGLRSDRTDSAVRALYNLSELT